MDPTTDSAATGRAWYTKKRVIIPAALIVGVIAIASVSGGGTDGSTDVPAASTSASQGSDTSGSAEAGIGTAVKDGKFEFTVTEVKALGKTVGSEYFNETAQGEFVGVTMTITNIGDEAQMFFDDNQYLIIDGKEYSANSMATAYLNEGSGFVDEINPGLSTTVTVVFDVPPGSAPTAVELHDSAFSSGVTVRLS